MTRKVWNYRCDACFNEAVVYQDTDLCYYCDPANYEELRLAEERLDAGREALKGDGDG